MNPAKSLFGNIDIYLFDQIQKQRFDAYHSVIDLGCGGGRNLVYFLHQGWDVYGLDPQPEAIEVVRELATSLVGGYSPDHFQVARMEDCPFGAQQFDVVICNAVLHFAKDHEDFEQMLLAAWEHVAPGGFFFARLASNVGIESKVQDLGQGLFLLPDGSVRYLVDEAVLLEKARQLGAIALEPIKTTVVQGLRSMTTWCLGKPAKP